VRDSQQQNIRENIQYLILFLKLSPLWFIIYFLFLFLKDIYKRLIYLNLQRFGHFKCPSSGDNCYKNKK
jgi:cell division protein FtsB